MRRIAHLLVESLLWLGAVLGVASVVVALVAGLGDVRPLVFKSGSMEPAISTGALAFSQKVDAREIAVGDIVSVTRGDGMRVTHRVVEIQPADEGALLTLKGDANPAPDAETYATAAAYRVIFDVPKAGYVVTALSTPWAAAGFVAVLLALLVSRLTIGGRGGRPRGGRRRAQTHKRAAPSRMAFVGLAAFWVVPQTFSPTMAAFTDTSVVTTGGIASGSVTKPVAVDCEASNPLIGTKRLTTTWQASSSPTALTYVAVIRETGQSLPITTSGSNRSVTVTGGLLGTLLGSSFNIDVTATLPGTSWTATSTRAGTYVLLGLGFSCGGWS